MTGQRSSWPEHVSATLVDQLSLDEAVDLLRKGDPPAMLRDGDHLYMLPGLHPKCQSVLPKSSFLGPWPKARGEATSTQIGSKINL